MRAILDLDEYRRNPVYAAELIADAEWTRQRFRDLQMKVEVELSLAEAEYRALAQEIQKLRGMKATLDRC